MSGPTVEVRGLSVAYDGRTALRDVTLDFPAGEVSAVIGPSGCGKTTLLTCLNRLTDLAADCRVTGSVRVGGDEVLDPKADAVAIRRRVGMIFQKPAPFPLSIRRNLDLPLREHGVRGAGERAGRIEAALRDAGLWPEVKDRLDAPAGRLSGGQQQRLCLARTLALRPEVVLLDEPCSSLDPISSAAVEDLIAGLRGRYTVIAVTHNLAQARRIADRTALFWWEEGAGRLLEAGPTEELFERPAHPTTRAYVTGARG